MLRRTAENDIKKWLKDDNRALLLTGARQTGKTYLIRQVLRETDTPYAEINFIEHPDYVQAFDNASGAEEIIPRLSVMTDQELIPGKTVIFLDEIQECREMVTQIKFLVDDGRFKYVLSGSLLGVELKGLRSVPVGYLKSVTLYPLSIEEFFSNIGVHQKTFDAIEHSFKDKVPVDDFIHRQLMKVFYLYLVVGGMPAAVQKYIDTENLSDVSDIQREIIRLYRRDFSKYAAGKGPELWDIYDAVPAELEENNKRFFISHVAGKVNFDRVKDRFLWLSDAGVVLPVYNVTELKAPLKISEKRNLFKLFMSDVGLLTSFYSDSVRLGILSNDPSINNGGLYENVVAQELYSHGFNNLWYYNSKSQGELDFLIEKDGAVLPIEVKSGKSYFIHSALSNILTSTEYNIEQAVVLCNDNLSVDDRITYMPIYMLMFFQKELTEDVRYHLDLSGI